MSRAGFGKPWTEEETQLFRSLLYQTSWGGLNTQKRLTYKEIAERMNAEGISDRVFTESSLAHYYNEILRLEYDPAYEPELTERAALAALGKSKREITEAAAKAEIARRAERAESAAKAAKAKRLAKAAATRNAKKTGSDDISRMRDSARNTAEASERAAKRAREAGREAKRAEDAAEALSAKLADSSAKPAVKLVEMRRLERLREAVAEGKEDAVRARDEATKAALRAERAVKDANDAAKLADKVAEAAEKEAEEAGE